MESRRRVDGTSDEQLLQEPKIQNHSQGIETGAVGPDSRQVEHEPARPAQRRRRRQARTDAGSQFARLYLDFSPLLLATVYSGRGWQVKVVF